MNVNFEIAALFPSPFSRVKKGGNFKTNIHLDSVDPFLYYLSSSGSHNFSRGFKSIFKLTESCANNGPHTVSSTFPSMRIIRWDQFPRIGSMNSSSTSSGKIRKKPFWSHGTVRFHSDIHFIAGRVEHIRFWRTLTAMSFDQSIIFRRSVVESYVVVATIWVGLNIKIDEIELYPVIWVYFYGPWTIIIWIIWIWVVWWVNWT